VLKLTAACLSRSPTAQISDFSQKGRLKMTNLKKLPPIANIVNRWGAIVQLPLTTLPPNAPIVNGGSSNKVLSLSANWLLEAAFVF
jgi:hypothetical protein